MISQVDLFKLVTDAVANGDDRERSIIAEEIKNQWEATFPIEKPAPDAVIGTKLIDGIHYEVLGDGTEREKA